MPLDAHEPYPRAGTLVDLVSEVLADLPLAHPGAPLFLERLAVELPIEISVEDGARTSLRLGLSPPTQTVDTSVLPVWHNLRLTLALETRARDDAGDDDG